MEVVIDIPEEEYREMLVDKSSGSLFEDMMTMAVQNGTPLPKGHGDLKDADAIMRELSVVSSRPVKSQMYIIKDALTIIEADGGGAE